MGGGGTGLMIRDDAGSAVFEPDARGRGYFHGVRTVRIEGAWRDKNFICHGAPRAAKDVKIR